MERMKKKSEHHWILFVTIQADSAQPELKKGIHPSNSMVNPSATRIPIRGTIITLAMSEMRGIRPKYQAVNGRVPIWAETDTRKRPQMNLTAPL